MSHAVITGKARQIVGKRQKHECPGVSPMGSSSWQSAAQTPLPFSWSQPCGARVPTVQRGARSGRGRDIPKVTLLPAPTNLCLAPQPSKLVFALLPWDGAKLSRGRGRAQLGADGVQACCCPSSGLASAPGITPWSLLGDGRRIRTSDGWYVGMGDGRPAGQGRSAGSSELTTPRTLLPGWRAFIINNSK